MDVTKKKYVKAIQLENCRREIIYSRVSLEDTSFSRQVTSKRTS